MNRSATYRVTGSGTGPRARPPEPDEKAKAPSGTKRVRRRQALPTDISSELREAAPPEIARRLELRIADAMRAYERDRYQEALTNLRELARSLPNVSAVRELLGLTYYRLGRWKESIRELELFGELTGSVEQLPVLADCYRALGRHARVEAIWGELRQAGAGSDVLAEGRLVMAGSLADRGEIAEAIALVEPAAMRPVRKPLPRHVRQWYVLADLYERSGDLPRARTIFRKVYDADPEMANVVERLSNLG